MGLIVFAVVGDTLFMPVISTGYIQIQLSLTAHFMGFI